ncbi:MAG TPA: OsmC family protein [Micromonosporaceae bacterium]|nr:OsmC family protein [Micromonosporaceae bacterium]
MTGPVHVRYVSGESYEIGVRQHRLLVDQSSGAGADEAPNPTEMFVASLAACVAYTAGRYLSRHGLSRDGLTVSAEYDVAEHPARVSAVRLTLNVPGGVPDDRRDPLLAVAGHCAVHNTLTHSPAVNVQLG